MSDERSEDPIEDSGEGGGDDGSGNRSRRRLGLSPGDHSPLLEAMVTIEKRTEGVMSDQVLMRRALQSLATQAQVQAAATGANAAAVRTVASEVTGLGVMLKATNTEIAALKPIVASTHALEGMVGQIIAKFAETDRVNADQDNRLERQDSITDEQGEKVAALTPKVAAHDALFKPTVVVRNMLLFAGGIAAYVVHVALGHLDSWAKIKHFFGH